MKNEGKSNEPSKLKPFLKWPGRKSKLLGELRKFYPTKGIRRYHEPMVGSGALFLDLFVNGRLKGAEVFLSDSNDELMTTWLMVRDRLGDLIEALKAHETAHRKDPESHFYRVRSMEPKDPVRVAARTIYLNRTCFNGLYRVNAKGAFNVSLGAYPKDVPICDAEKLTEISKSVQTVNLDTIGYEFVLENAEEGDFVFIDPPYLPASKTSNFTFFTKEGFRKVDHELIAKAMKTLDQMGCLVLLTNSDQPATRKLYEDFHIHPVKVYRNISCTVESRGMAKEIVVCNSRLKRMVGG